MPEPWVAVDEVPSHLGMAKDLGLLLDRDQGNVRSPGRQPTRILKLSHASDEDLLLKRRIENLLSRSSASPPDASDEEMP